MTDAPAAAARLSAALRPMNGLLAVAPGERAGRAVLQVFLSPNTPNAEVDRVPGDFEGFAVWRRVSGHPPE